MVYLCRVLWWDKENQMSDQATKIADKAKWLREHLEAWQQVEQVLGVGQQLVFELRVEDVPLVAYVASGTPVYAAIALPISGLKVNSSEFAAGKTAEIYAKPAVLDASVIAEVLSWFPEGTIARNVVQRLLVQERNNPMLDDTRRVGSAHQTKINNILRAHDTESRKLRLALRHRKYQIWEIK